MGMGRKLALGLLMTAGVSAGEAATAKPAEAATVVDREAKDGRVEALDIGLINFAPDVYTKEQQDEIIDYLLFQDELFRSIVNEALKQGLHIKRSLTAEQIQQVLRNAKQKKVNQVKIAVEDPSAQYKLAPEDVVSKDSRERQEMIEAMVEKFMLEANLHTHKN